MTRQISMAIIGIALAGCGSSLERDEWLSPVAGSAAVLAETSAEEADRSRLIATNLVSVLAQLPATPPSVTTVQVSMPRSAFGNAVVRALGDAGYGLQRVSADQGPNYVGYGRRVAETEAGSVTDYRIAIGPVEVRREYVVEEGVLLPASLVEIDGIEALGRVSVDDAMFSERGGVDRRFVSGVRAGDDTSDITEVDVRSDSGIAEAERRTALDVLAASRERGLAAPIARDDVTRDGYLPVRRTILMVDAGDSRRLGRANKVALRYLVRERLDDDIFMVTACLQMDGKDEAGTARGLRVVEELLALGVAAAQIDLAPCRRVSFRHDSDDAPLPVEVVQARRQ